jgi:hypothetical protein|tara:strand:- start:8896 stop:9432 length:537 start_codon:yes stop_codon:yes gene_type:complete
MPMEFAGDKNTSEETRFRFACPDPKCKGKETFFAVWETAPDIVPSGMPCPFEGDHDAKWIVAGIAKVHIAGSVGGISNPHYTTVRADAEHKWMGMQIEEAKRALAGDEQLEGKAASPYGKWQLNEKEALDRGVIKAAPADQAADRQRLMDERSKQVADKAKDKLTDIEKKHVGHRHDG